MPERSEIVNQLKAALDAERFEHSLRVEKTALALGKKWGVSREKIIPAALLHDCARRYDRRRLLKEAGKIGLEIDPIRRFEPKLFHAEISAYLAEKEFGIRSKAVLQAIRRHTVGAAGMSKLDKVIYLADHIEEGRDFAGVKKIRALAFKDLDRAVLLSTGNMIRYLVDFGLPIYPGTVETRNYFALKRT